MAGIFHAYYTVALAPAMAALVGMGAREAWERKDTAFGAISLAVAMAATSVWSFLLLSRVTTWNPWLRVVVLALGLAAALLFLVVGRLHRRALPALVGLGLFAALLGPAAYSVQTVSVGHSGSIVTAGPSTGGTGGPGGGGMPVGTAPGGMATGGTTPGQAAPGGGAAPGGTAQGGVTGGGTRGTGGVGGLLN